MTLSLLCVSVVSILLTLPACASTVRIDPAGGAPRIVVDGQPVRARMFYGGRSSAPLPIGPEASVQDFVFTAVGTAAGNGTVHFRFGAAPGEVILDDIRVTDLDTGADVVPTVGFEGGQDDFERDWAFWPTGEENTTARMEVLPGVGRDGSAGLKVSLTPPPPGEPWPDFHIYHRANLTLEKGHSYRMTFWVRADAARNLLVAFYRPGAPFVFLGGPAESFTSQIELAAAVGVDLVSFAIGCPWPEPGEEADFGVVDAICRDVLNANPNALLLPRFGVEPPAWWKTAHPDDVMVWEDGSRPHGVVVASEAYRRDAARNVAALVSHLEETLGDRMAGYHPCGQHTGEWFYLGTWTPLLNGYSVGDTREFRRWLTETYATDAALAEAWADPDVTLETAAVPSAKSRHAALSGVLRDPVAERPILDFSRFQQEAMADCVCALARAAREACGGRKLVTFFYGYVFEFGAVGNGPATSGHYALRRVLDCPDIDLLCSPISYCDRGLGQSAPAMTAAESVALAGKMWLYEDDTATYLSSGTYPGWQDKVETLAQTNAQLVRNVAQCAMRNFATWWMDLGATGWFDDPGMWAEMARLEALDRALLDTPTPYRPPIAAVLDETSMLRVAAGGTTVTRPAVYEVRRALARTGAPYGQYLMDDVAAGRVEAEVYVMLATWALSPQQRTDLLRATRGAAKVWCYAPGYHDGYSTSLPAMRELTGFELAPITLEKALAEPTEAGRALGLTRGLGVDGPVTPLFAATDATAAETLATYPDGSAAIALRQTPDGPSLFVGPPGLTSELLRLIAGQAGVHLYTQTDCNVYQNGPYVALHTCEAGPLEVNTGAAEPVVDMLTGETISRGPVVSLETQMGESYVWRVRADR